MANNNDQNNNSRRYLNSNVGMSNQHPFAFHLEGNLTKDPAMLPEKEDKPSMAVCGLGINEGGFALLARAKGEPKLEGEAAGTNFLQLCFTGKIAEKIVAEAHKGDKIAVTGVMSTYKGNNGTESVEVFVENYILLPRSGGKRTKRLSYAPQTYQGREGLVTQSVVTLLTGKVSRIDDIATSKSGNDYLRASMQLTMPVEKVWDCVNSGKPKEYADDASRYINMVFFSDSAVRMAKLLRKDMVIAVTGRINQDIYNGNTSYTLRPSTVSVIDWGDKDNATESGKEEEPAAPAQEATPASIPAPARAESPAPYPAAPAYSGAAGEDDDDDGELPF